MNSPTLLERIAALDLQLRDVDSKLIRAYADPNVHPKILNRLLSVRNDLTRRWGAMWQTKRVSP